MRKTIIIASVGLLGLLMVSGCYPTNNLPDDAERMERIARDDFGNDVSKACDNGRAIYVTDAANGRDSLVVVENAPECGTS